MRGGSHIGTPGRGQRPTGGTREGWFVQDEGERREERGEGGGREAELKGREGGEREQKGDGGEHGTERKTDWCVSCLHHLQCFRGGVFALCCVVMLV